MAQKTVSFPILGSRKTVNVKGSGTSTQKTVSFPVIGSAPKSSETGSVAKAGNTQKIIPASVYDPTKTSIRIFKEQETARQQATKTISIPILDPSKQTVAYEGTALGVTIVPQKTRYSPIQDTKSTPSKGVAQQLIQPQQPTKVSSKDPFSLSKRIADIDYELTKSYPAASVAQEIIQSKQEKLRQGSEDYSQRVRDYESKVAAYESTANRFNKRVEGIGVATPQDVRDLESQKKYLVQQQKELEAEYYDLKGREAGFKTQEATIKSSEPYAELNKYSRLFIEKQGLESLFYNPSVEKTNALGGMHRETSPFNPKFVYSVAGLAGGMYRWNMPQTEEEIIKEAPTISSIAFSAGVMGGTGIATGLLSGGPVGGAIGGGIGLIGGATGEIVRGEVEKATKLRALGLAADVGIVMGSQLLSSKAIKYLTQPVSMKVKSLSIAEKNKADVFYKVETKSRLGTTTKFYSGGLEFNVKDTSFGTIQNKPVPKTVTPTYNKETVEWVKQAKSWHEATPKNEPVFVYGRHQIETEGLKTVKDFIGETTSSKVVQIPTEFQKLDWAGDFQSRITYNKFLSDTFKGRTVIDLHTNPEGFSGLYFKRYSKNVLAVDVPYRVGEGIVPLTEGEKEVIFGAIKSNFKQQLSMPVTNLQKYVVPTIKRKAITVVSEKGIKVVPSIEEELARKVGFYGVNTPKELMPKTTIFSGNISEIGNKDVLKISGTTVKQPLLIAQQKFPFVNLEKIQSNVAGFAEIGKDVLPQANIYGEVSKTLIPLKKSSVQSLTYSTGKGSILTDKSLKIPFTLQDVSVLKPEVSPISPKGLAWKPTIPVPKISGTSAPLYSVPKNVSATVLSKTSAANIPSLSKSLATDVLKTTIKSSGTSNILKGVSVAGLTVSKIKPIQETKPVQLPIVSSSSSQKNISNVKVSLKDVLKPVSISKVTTQEITGVKTKSSDLTLIKGTTIQNLTLPNNVFETSKIGEVEAVAVKLPERTLNPLKTKTRTFELPKITTPVPISALPFGVLPKVGIPTWSGGVGLRKSYGTSPKSQSFYVVKSSPLRKAIYGEKDLVVTPKWGKEFVRQTKASPFVSLPTFEELKQRKRKKKKKKGFGLNIFL